MDDVPVKDLEVIEVKMRKAFVRIAKKGLDMRRMGAVINSHELTVRVNFCFFVCCFRRPCILIDLFPPVQEQHGRTDGLSCRRIVC